MRTAGTLALVFLVSAVVAFVLISLLLTTRPHLSWRLSANAAKSAATVGTYGQAPRLAAVAHLRKVQDEYVTFLQSHPGDPAAMRGLVAVRRAIAGGDAVVLRQQVLAYREMANRNVENPEHYAAAGLELLVAANLQAAAAIEAEQRTAPETGHGGTVDSRQALSHVPPPPAAPQQTSPAAPRHASKATRSAARRARWPHRWPTRATLDTVSHSGSVRNPFFGGDRN